MNISKEDAIREVVHLVVPVLRDTLQQGPRSNFWIEGAECLASQGRGGGCEQGRRDNVWGPGQKF